MGLGRATWIRIGLGKWCDNASFRITHYPKYADGETFGITFYPKFPKLGRLSYHPTIPLAITAIGVGAYLVWRHWGTIKAAFVAAWSWFKGMKNQFFAAGGELINGLVAGISSKLAAARDTVVALGNNIKGWFKSALGINSPSRVFMGFGDNIAQGAALGIQRTGPAAARAAAVMAGATLAASVAAASPMQNRLQQSVQAAASSSGATAKAQSGGAMTVHFSPQITLQGDGGSSISAQLEKATRLSFAEFEELMRRYDRDRNRRAN